MARIQWIGSKLRSDREQKGLSREALVASSQDDGGFSISLSTLRDAEQGSASERNMARIAALLGFSKARYTVVKKATFQPMISMDGRWYALFQEQDVATEPYVVIERLEVNQVDDDVSGIYTTEEKIVESPDEQVRSFEMHGKLIGDTICGAYGTGDSNNPHGSGVYQLKIMKDDCWAEGFCTFSTDDKVIALSYNIWVRREIPLTKVYLDQAIKQIQKRSLFMTAPLLPGG